MTSNAPASFRSGNRWYVLGVLTLIYALNIADRYVVSTVLEPIRRDLQLSDASVAFLTGVALALFYVTVGLPIAALADRANRRTIVTVSLAIWSAMTALCGRAYTFWQLLVARFGVGIGEAGGTPPSTSMLADTFAPRDRPMALTIFALGAPIGAWIGSQLAGAIAQSWGWRSAFLALGVPGLIVAAITFFSVHEPQRGRFESAPPPPSTGYLMTLRWIRRQRSALHVIAGGTIATLWGWGLMWWTPTFLIRSYGLTVGEAGAVLGPIHLIAGTAATVVTGVVVSLRWAHDSRRIVWLLGGVILLATGPSVWIYVTSSRPTAVALLWVVIPAVYFFLGPAFGILQNIVPATMRAQTVAVLLFTANVANLIIAPQAVGLISDALAPRLGGNAESLRWALIGLATTGVWAAYHYIASARTIRADEERAMTGSDS